MSQNPDEVKPLSLMEKISVGVKSFVKSAVEYVPSGLLYSGLMIGGSLALSYMTGGAWDILGLMSGGSISMSALAIKGLGTVALGSAVTGAIGAYKGVSQASEQRNAEVEWQQRGVEISPRARGLQRQQGAGFGTGMATPQRGLPSQQQSGQRIAPGF
jgi:hypothetical protein